MNTLLSDFEYPTSIPSFEFDLFPTSSSQFFSNPFSPAAPTPPYLSEPNRQSLSSSQHAFHIPPVASTSQLLPTESNSIAPLFDESESALFTSFLNTLDVDQNFLFNPILPPGMPSPPSTIYPMREEERRERERLGEGVNGLDIGYGFSSSTRQYGVNEYEEAYHVKEEDEEESMNWNRNGESSNRRSRGEREEASRDDDLRSTSSGKKLKLRDDQGWEREKDEAVEIEEDIEDVDMDSANFIEPSRTSGRANAGRKRTYRTSITPSVLTASTTRPRRTSTNTRQAIPVSILSSSSKPSGSLATREQSLSPDRNRSASPSQSPEDSGNNPTRKVPLTESQKRSNHILSEQRRRNAIRSGFKDLFDLLSNGETASGIVVVPSLESEDGNKKKKTKGSGRGRGRKGEVGAGASKSVVLEKAGEYIQWLERGNKSLEEELARVENFR